MNKLPYLLVVWFFCFFQLTLLGSTIVETTDNNLSTRLTINPFGLNGETDLYAVTLTVFNQGSQDITKLQIGTQVDLFNGGLSKVKLEPIFCGDPNKDNTLEPGEFWIYSSVEQFDKHSINNYRVVSAVLGEDGEQKFTSSCTKELILNPINMDVNINADVTDTAYIELVTRLLIDEDASVNPGTTTIVVGGIPITIQLPKSRWEARDIALTVDGINNGLPFDPFDPPDGIEFEIFCDQGEDDGRVIGGILDELEPVNTVRFPCDSVGQDDIICEFPDWMFCYILSGDDVPNVICASDNFSIWKAEESKAGSGMYKPFVDITSAVDSGGQDCEEVDFLDVSSSDIDRSSKITFYPNPSTGMINSKSETGNQEAKFVIYNLAGQRIEAYNSLLNASKDLSHLSNGQYIISVFDLAGRQIGKEQITIVK